MSIYYTVAEVISLVHKKNEINRRRRRFYSIMSPRYGTKIVTVEERVRGSIGYEKAKVDGKSLMGELRLAYRSLGAHLHWNDSGGIEKVCIPGLRPIPAKRFKELAEMDAAVEKYLLSGDV